VVGRVWWWSRSLLTEGVRCYGREGCGDVIEDGGLTLRRLGKVHHLFVDWEGIASYGNVSVGQLGT